MLETTDKNQLLKIVPEFLLSQNKMAHYVICYLQQEITYSTTHIYWDIRIAIVPPEETDKLYFLPKEETRVDRYMV